MGEIKLSSLGIAVRERVPTVLQVWSLLLLRDSSWLKSLLSRYASGKDEEEI